METIPKPQQSFKEGEDYLNKEEIAQFESAFKKAVQPEFPGLEDADFESLSDEAQKDIIELETDLATELDKAHAVSAKKQLGLIRGSIKKVLGFFDLDSKENAMEALIEVVPYVGAVYALTGRKIEITKEGPKLEKISWTERGLYLAGELLISGHLLVGVRRSIVKQGMKIAMKEAAKVGAKRTGVMLVRRGQQKLSKES